MAGKNDRPDSRTISCYLCEHGFTVDAETMSTTCPGCHRRIVVEDLVLKKNRPKLVMVTELMTCGRLIVPKGSRVVADVVAANEGMEVRGHLEARQIRSAGLVVIGKKAFWRGGLQAAALVVEDSAVIDRGAFQVAGAS